MGRLLKYIRQIPFAMRTIEQPLGVKPIAEPVTRNPGSDVNVTPSSELTLLTMPFCEML
jgi:hypothetical protein